MKKIILVTLFSTSAMLFAPAQSMAGTKSTTELSDDTKETERVNALLNKYYDTKSSDKASLTRSERRELRKELRATKAKMQHDRGHGGIYISGGAIIIIILLIILL